MLLLNRDDLRPLYDLVELGFELSDDLGALIDGEVEEEVLAGVVLLVGGDVLALLEDVDDLVVFDVEFLEEGQVLLRHKGSQVVVVQELLHIYSHEPHILHLGSE